MEVKEFNIKGRKNLQLSVMTVKDDVPTKGVVQIFHGMGEHKNRYIPFAKYLAKEGYVVIAHDHRKHGHSVEKETDLGIFVKGDVWDDIITDCYIVTGHIFKEYPRLPITVLGHSMGSIIAREFLGRYSDVASKAIIMGTLPEIKMGKAIAPIMISNILNLFNFKNKPSNFIKEISFTNFNIFIVLSVAGGTGSSIYLDLTKVLYDKLYEKLPGKFNKPTVLLYMPDAFVSKQKPENVDRYKTNVFAFSLLTCE